MKYAMLALLIASNAQAEMTKDEFYITVYAATSFIMFDDACKITTKNELFSEKCLDALDKWVEKNSVGMPEK